MATGAIPPSGSFSINDVMQMVQQSQPKGGTFRKVAGALVGGVGNMLMPGVGSAIGNMISGGPAGALNMLGPGASQFLSFQQEMATETEKFEMASTIMKNRHDSAMSAIRNMKSS